MRRRLRRVRAAGEDHFVKKPANLTFEQAAAVGVSASTALQLLRDDGKVQPGQKVLINGASGGVGTFAVQIAKAFGAEVTGVTSTKNVELVRSIGADHVIDYTREDFTSGAERYDLILDNVGNHSMARTRRALTPGGTLISNGGGHADGKLGRTVRAMLASMVVRQQASPTVKTQNHDDLVALKGLVEAGKVTPVIDRTYPLTEDAGGDRSCRSRPRPRNGRGHRLTATVRSAHLGDHDQGADRRSSSGLSGLGMATPFRSPPRNPSFAKHLKGNHHVQGHSHQALHRQHASPSSPAPSWPSRPSGSPCERRVRHERPRLVGISGGALAWSLIGLGILGAVAAMGGAIGGLVSWIGALLNTWQLDSKGWFVGLLLLGIFNFGFFAMIAYVLAGPDGTAEAAVRKGRLPPNPHRLTQVPA